MAPNNRIVMVAIKPRSSSEQLLNVATEILGDNGGRLHLFSALVITGDEDASPERLGRIDRELAELESRVSANWDTSLRGTLSVTHRVRVNAGNAGSAIVTEARDTGASFLVIGLAKRTRVGKAIFGSDAQTAILMAECPVVSCRIAAESQA